MRAIEAIFLVLPVAAAPFALRVIPRLVDGVSPAHRVATWLQPIAAAALITSFLLPVGALAGALVAPWAAVAILLVVGNARRARGNLRAGLIFLPFGVVWLAMARTGVGPPGLAPATVFLGALHFHFTGFALQVLLAVVAPARVIRILPVVGIPLIAAGNLAHLPPLKAAGVAAVSLGTIAFGVVLVRSGRPPLLRVAGASIVAAMLLALLYGAGELCGRGWIAIDHMALAHGLLNAVGFTFLGLVALRRVSIS